MPLKTLDYRNAPGYYGPHAFTWKDKPHRLIYDLCEEIERLNSQRYDPQTNTLEDVDMIDMIIGREYKHKETGELWVCLDSNSDMGHPKGRLVEGHDGLLPSYPMFAWDFTEV